MGIVIILIIVVGALYYRNSSGSLNSLFTAAMRGNQTYKSTLTYETAPWNTTLNMSYFSTGNPNQICPIIDSSCYSQVPVYQVSGFYYVNATAKNYTCWVTKIVKTNPSPSENISLTSDEADNVTNHLSSGLAPGSKSSCSLHNLENPTIEEQNIGNPASLYSYKVFIANT